MILLQTMTSNIFNEFDYYNVSPPQVDPNLIDEFGNGAEAQDMNAWLEKADSRYQKWLESKNKKEKRIVSKKKNNLKDASFIKKRNHRGCFVIKIQIEALDGQDKSREVTAQYVTQDSYDDILDDTENIIKKMSTKITEN